MDDVVTVKLLAAFALPPGVVTENLPVVAPLGTVAVIWLALFTVNDAAVPLRRRLFAFMKLVPLMTTVAPTCPLVGLNPVMAGAGRSTVTLKLAAELALPLAVVTEILPVVAPFGTVVMTCVALLTVKEAGVPLNVIAVVPLRLLPVMVTRAFTVPLEG